MVYNCSFPFDAFISIKVYVFAVLLSFGLFLYSFYRSGLLEERWRLSLLGILLFLSGGSYNLFNRYTHGCLKDPFRFFSTFSFNFADVLVVLGLAILLCVYIIGEKAKNE